MDTVLVTGCLGFVGKHLVRKLVEEGYDVWGVDKSRLTSSFPGREFISMDLADASKVAFLFEKVKPLYIVHLAAQASAGRSFEDPLGTINANLFPSLHILEALRLRKAEGRLLAIGSADEYGPVDPVHLPLVEARRTNPVSPYGLSKMLQYRCCKAYAALYDVDVVVTRSFNHTGPGQRENFVLPSFAKQIVEIKYGVREPVIEVGNIDVKRDFLDVRDVVEAYIALLHKGRKGEVYNVCSGKAYSIRELLTRMCRLADVKLNVEVKEERVRRFDAQELRGNKLKITRDTGWSPKIMIEDTLQSLLDYWEKVIAGKGR